MNNNYNNGLIERAQRIFSDRYESEISDEEAVVMLDNLKDFTALLLEIEKKTGAKNGE